MRRAAALIVSCVAAAALYGGVRPEVVMAEVGYGTLVKLFEEWRAFQRPRTTHGVPDYTAAAMQKQHKDLAAWRKRLDAIDSRAWPIPEQVDKEIVAAEMNGLDFDHRVLRPWSRNPCFYAVVHEGQSDTPAHEGHVQAGAIELWQFRYPLSPERRTALAEQLRAIPAILDQAKLNLVEDARDLWMLAIGEKRNESALLSGLEKTLQQHHPELVPDARRAREAVDSFRSWLETKVPTLKGRSGVGASEYDWYLKNVHLSPYTLEQERTLHIREWNRSTAHLALQRKANETLPELSPIATAGEYRARYKDAVTEYMRFLGDKGILTVTPDMDPSLREREDAFIEPADRDFFAQIDYRDPIVMRCHGTHWFDLARMKNAPHKSPIRRAPLLYNIWDSRAEGLATAMEEMMMTAGLLEKHPRAKELVYALVANRAARGLAGLRQHAQEIGVDQALQVARDGTPNGWLKLHGATNTMEQRLYLEQPGYSTCYLSGKAQIESLLAERALQLGPEFSMRHFMDEFFASGMIPVSLIRWEMTGRR